MLRRVTPATLPSVDEGPSRLEALAPVSRITELAAGPSAARTTLAASLVVEAQMLGEPVAWIERTRGVLFPPDLAAAGVDLDALVLVRVGEDPYGGPRAAELLLRSGAFGLVVIDIAHVTTPQARATEAWVGRLASLARLHESRVVVIGGRPVSAPALGTLVSVRIETRRAHLGAHRFALEHDAVRYKSHLAPPHGHTVHRAPRGFMERRAH